MSRSNELVVVTGASGFLGSEVTLGFLRAGFRVRGTVRHQAQADAWYTRWPQYVDQLEFALVPDMKLPKAFKDAIKGADYVIHTASPALAALDDVVENIEQDLLRPPINASIDLMETLAAEPTVKAIVLTSSFTTCKDYTKPQDPNKVYTYKDWGPLTYEQAAAMPISRDASQMMVPYSAGKALAEKAAWDYVAEKKPNFTFSTVLPTWITGPSSDPGLYKISDLRNNTSSKIWEQLVDKKEITEPYLLSKYVDVRDCANMHVQVILQPEAQGKRYLSLAGSSSVENIAQVLRKLFPEQAARIVPVPADKPFVPLFGADGSPAEKIMGLKYRTLEESMKDWGDQYFNLEK